jgi:uncharacterized coiled-coil DUF342 family protein
MTMVEEVREVRAPVREAEVPWVVSYLREDIQDLRNEVRETRRLTVESYEKLDAKIEGLRQDMDAKIDARTGELRQEIGELGRTMTVQFRWLVTTMVAVGALVVAILELLR